MREDDEEQQEEQSKENSAFPGFTKTGNQHASRAHTAQELGYALERSVLAHPTFVFEKKDRPLKRPAEEPVCKAENGNNHLTEAV
ncbi:hypothetical protein Anapl_18206 [Anas platyrhynchos]|uniref:Uncharacterized protein n=1 Tax=Anas platyrhynchos TaxID=8839 RepID=R0KPB7_ANAPL|nr:hypothetical protein Anapl_18206 [Anas platyrhynchos]